MRSKQVFAQQLLSAVLFVAVLGMLAFLTHRYKLEADWTAGNRNTLTEGSRTLLAALPEPVTFKAFLYPRSEQRPLIEADIRRYQRLKSDITLEFIDPSTNPQAVRDYNIQRPGEIVVEYQGRRENIGEVTEQAISAALQRLADAGERWIVFIEGHGERGTDDAEPAGYAQLAQVLRDKGLKVQGLNLVRSPKIPDNTSVLVLAAPRSKLLEGEAKLVAQYVENGGNLLWLVDPDTPVTPEPLARALGVTWLEGLVIDPVALQLQLPLGFFVPAQYPQHPALKDFEVLTIFPLARGLKADAGKAQAQGWMVQPLLESQPQAWVETSKNEAAPDANEVQGVITVGVTLTRERAPAEGAADAKPQHQRIVLVGDADFAANDALSEQGNSPLAQNLMQWLALRDAQINVDVPKAPDVSLVLPAWGVILIRLGFCFLLPMALLAFGVTRWAIRRRA